VALARRSALGGSFGDDESAAKPRENLARPGKSRLAGRAASRMGKDMIKLTRLDGEQFVLNADLIRYVERRPDTLHHPNQW